MHEQHPPIGMNIGQDVTAFWGKTYNNRFSVDGAPLFKPVVHHLFDAAAVAYELLESRPAFLARLSQTLGVASPVARNLCALIAGLHDLGKFSIPFQAKVPDLWPSVALGPSTNDFPVDAGHWRYTALLMHEGPAARLLEAAFGAQWTDIRDDLKTIAAGHHGQPPEIDWLGVAVPSAPARTLRSESRALPEACQDAAATATAALLSVLAEPDFSTLQNGPLKRLSLLLNGLVTTADWVASGFAQPEGRAGGFSDAGSYWRNARDEARHAIKVCGLEPLPAATIGWRALGLRSEDLRPMQVAVDQVTIAPGPNLFILEDMTGAGKTEAALMLALRLMLAGKGEGIYFALPTMATANAMHKRLADCHRTFFATRDGVEPSLVLAHAKAGLARRIARLGADGISDGVAAHCNDWIADSRRKALFADIGAGTIDQAFLAVLRKKFLTLRQFALANRILIVDEAHSFDAYMGVEMQTLLRLHAMNGGSAIVLSATLTTEKRQQFAKVFHEGCRRQPTEAATTPMLRRDRRASNAIPTLSSRAFPLLTQVHGGGVSEQPAAHFDTGRPSVKIIRLDSRSEAVSQAIAAARRGAAVAVICNAVDEAMATHAAIRTELGDPEAALLFHARFAMADRMRIEQRVLHIFGKDADRSLRAGKILIATQVIEQSLDLDFDFMVSDLAPFDLIVQRAGRLWRHMQQRPAMARPVSGPCLAVISPVPANVQSPRWLEPVLGAGAFVYRHPGYMWRTAKQLFERGALPQPDEPDFRSMLDDTYAAETDDLPECLRAAADQASGDDHGKGSLGSFNVIEPEAGYGALSGGLGNNEDIGTRLGEPQATLRLARREGGQLVPWADYAGADLPLLWALSEVTLDRKWLGKGSAPAESEEVKAVKATWPEFEQSIFLAEVGGDGTLVSISKGLVYDTDIGLIRRASAPHARG